METPISAHCVARDRNLFAFTGPIGEPETLVFRPNQSIRLRFPSKSFMPPRPMSTRSRARKRSRVRSRTRRKDPIFVDGHRPRPMYVDYKDLELLSKMVNRQGRIMGRRKSGCTAASQHAVTSAIKRARFMALLPYVGE
ncbi:30S ribosomal protein S18 [Rhodopirellula islandica]|uniref:Small ribosomal subunit protein bS18 n=3 Tax=Pirellulaceae TaxID=2691357 RepID=A0A0J1B9V1_RHOIS|nr:30S ribosomal protein S18 [Rhodopirellula islandica]